MEKENDKKAGDFKNQMKDRALIVKGKAQAVAHQVADIVDDLKGMTELAIEAAKEKGPEVMNSAKEEIQASINRTRKKTIDMLEQARQKLESSAQKV